MPPIRPLEDAFLAHLLEPDENISDDILKNSVSTETLTTVLQKLNATSHALQQELYQHVQQHFEPFSRYYNKSQDIHSRMASITDQLSSTESQVQNTRQKTTQTINTYKQMWKSSHSNRAKMDALQQLKQLLQEEKTVRQYIKTHQYLEAVDQMRNVLLPHLQQWEQEEAGDDRIVHMLKRRLDELNQSLVGQLQDSLNIAVQFNHGSLQVLEKFSPLPSTATADSNRDTNAVHVRDVLYCFYQLGLLPDELMSIQHALFKNIINVYFDCKNCKASIEPVEEENVGKGSILRISSQHQHGQKAEDEDLINAHQEQDDEENRPAHAEPLPMFKDMKIILSFLYNAFFRDGDVENDREMKNMLGKLLMPDLMSLMIQESIAPSVPSAKYNLSDFEPIATAATEFEKHCQQHYGFDVITDTDVTTLSSYIQHIDKHYARKRREKILQEGRKVMIRRLYDTEQVTEKTDSHTYQYHITQTPQLLNVFISDTLSEAAALQKDGHPISASTLIEGIQDLLDMYRAIMPSFHRSHYLSSAANSLVFRNDCYWLAHQLTQPQQQQHGFDQWTSYANNTSVRLQELGNAWYELAFMRCVSSLQSVLEPLEGFTGMAENKKFQQDCDRAMSKIIELVGAYATEIQSVVDEQALFLDILGRIVDHVLQQLIQDIESLADIGADESHIIAQNFNTLARLVGAFDIPGQDATESFVMGLVPSWQKFWLLKDILEMNMRDIMDAYRQGKLHMFERSELVGLLSSLFADTDLREKNIKEIKEGRYPSPMPTTTEHETLTPTPVFTTSTPVTTNLPAATATVGRSMATPAAAGTSPAPTYKTTTSGTKQHLTYTPHDMEVDAAVEGWGDEDDDDLFNNQDLPTESAEDIEEEDEDNADEKPTTVDSSVLSMPSTVSTPSPASSPQKNHLSLMVEDMDIEEAAADGWADDDEDDLFDREEENKTGVQDKNEDQQGQQPITQAGKEEEEGEEGTQQTRSDMSKQEKPTTSNQVNASISSSPTSSALNYRDDLLLNEMDDDDEGGGWDDDEALFDEEDMELR